MARTIDGDALYQEFEAMAWYDNADRDLAEDMLLRMPTLTPPNKPLTLEQLREMDGQPVWDSSLRCWGIVKSESEKDGDVFLQTKSGEFGLDPLGRVKIYRRPPEGEA